MSERIRIDHGSLEAGKRRVQLWRIPKSMKSDVLRFLDDLAMGKVNRGKRLSPHRQLKYLHALRTPLQFFNKTLPRLTVADIERFEVALESGELSSELTGKPYAHSTKADMRLLLNIFVRWRLGASKASKLTGWLDTRPRRKTPDYLKESEVERLYKHCRDARQRFLIAVLFDSGARAEEFHNIRCEDIELPEGKELFVKLTLKEEYSKTCGRTLSLFWKHSVEAVKEYLSERRKQGIGSSDPVFVGGYSAMRKTLQRLGFRVLGRSVHYHLLRHSSATYYASKLNRQELCLRYGWRFSSVMPDVYINRAGMATKDLDERFAQTELSALQDDLTRVNQENKIKNQRIEELQATVTRIRQEMDRVSQILALNPSVHQIQTALDRKRRASSKRKD